MKKRLLCIMLASLFLLPLIGSIPISAADGSYRYSISFDYEMTGASDSFDFLFNQRTNNNTNDYLRWRFTANSVQPSKRGSYLNLIVTSYRWNDYTASPLPTSATVGSVINVRIDVYADDIETYINGELCNTTTFATINSADTRNGTFAPNPTSQVGLNSRNNTGTKYMDNLVGINYTGDSPDYMFYAIFDSVNPFSGAGTSLVGGRLEIAGGTSGTISGTSDTTHRWINLSQAVLPPSMALPIIIGEFSEYNPDDYVSWAWPQFQRALDAALVVKNNPESTEANFGDAITMLNTAKTRLTSATENANLIANDYKSWSWSYFESALASAKLVYENENATDADFTAALADLSATKSKLSSINDTLNLNSYDLFRPDGAQNLSMGRGIAAIVMDFSDTSINSWILGRNNCTTTFENGIMRVNVTREDPYITFAIPQDKQFSADEFRYAKISLKNTSNFDLSEFFFGTNVNPGPAGPDNTPFIISTNDTEFQSYVIDMIDDCATPGRWTGTVNTFRWDPVEDRASGSVATGSVFYCEYIAFFKTREEAESFDPATFDFSSAALTDGFVGGSLANEWQRVASSTSLVYDLKETYNISAVSLIPAQNNIVAIDSAPNFPFGYTIDFSTDGENWFGAITESGKLSEIVKSDPQLSVPTSATYAQYVRVTLTESQPGASGFALAEIVVYGKGGYVDLGIRNLYIPSSSDGWNPIFPTSKYPSGVTPSPANISWTSSDKNVITVDESGFVKAVGFGSATLTAYDTLYEITATWEINVLEGQDKTGIMDQIIISIFFPPCENGSGAKTDDYQYKLMADAGINFISKLTTYPPANRAEALKIADLCAKYGMWLLTTEMNEWGNGNDSEYVRHMNQAQLEDYATFWRDIPGVGGFMLVDEPQNSDDMNAYGDLVSKLKTLAPNLLMHVSDKPNQNLTYVRNYVNRAIASGYKPDYIGDCEYPFQYTPTQGRVKDTWFTYMNNYKNIAQEFGIKTHRYLQVEGGSGMGSNYPIGMTGNHIRYEMYTGLMYGVKRFEYFTWGVPGTNWGPAIVDWNGDPTPLYDEIVDINANIHAISDIIYPLQPSAIYRVNNTGHGSNGGLVNLPNTFLAQPGDSNPMFYSYMWEPDEEHKAPNPANTTNYRYLMVVDDRFPNQTSTTTFSTAPRSHTINFINGQATGLVGLVEISNLDGSETYIDLASVNYLVTRDYLVGEGKLFRLIYEQNVSGTITDAETEETLEGAIVTLYDASGDKVAITETDENGDYVFENVRTGSYTITAEAPDYRVGSIAAKVVAVDLFGMDIALVRTSAYFLDQLASKILKNGLSADQLILSANNNATLTLVIDGKEFILATGVNNRNVSGSIELADGSGTLIFDIKGDGKNIKAFEIVKRED